MYTRLPPENYSGTFIGQPNSQNQPPDGQFQGHNCPTNCQFPPPRDENCPQDQCQFDQCPPEQRQFDQCPPAPCPPDQCERPPGPPCEPPKPPKPPESKGLLGGLFGKLGGIELDDILLLGLIFLLANGRGDDCENSDDLLLILGLLFFMGFGK